MYIYILREDGVPVRAQDPRAWRRWMEESDRVLATDREHVTKVTTSFGGVDMRPIVGSGPPLLFETEIQSPAESRMIRTATRMEALRIHGQVVAALRRQVRG